VNPAALNFRFATAADAPAIADLVESGYRGDRSRAGWTTEADLLEGQRTSAEGVLEILSQPDSHVLLGECIGEDGALVLIASAQLERHDGHAYFGMFSVRPGLQNGGYGKQMLAEAERIAREEWGAQQMRMSVIEQRAELIAWYERRGYVRTGEFLPFPYGDERFGLPKRPDLRFLVLAKPFA
jgi:ribosomal protein S18 acetylase RimI-like enzyme